MIKEDITKIDILTSIFTYLILFTLGAAVISAILPSGFIHFLYAFIVTIYICKWLFISAIILFNVRDLIPNQVDPQEWIKDHMYRDTYTGRFFKFFMWHKHLME